MNKLLQHRHIIRENLITVIGICLCLYFSYHTMQGSRSALRLMTLSQTIETKSLNSHKLKNKREALEAKVAMMRPGSMSKDLLEERARVVLGYKYEDEIAILRN